VLTEEPIVLSQLPRLRKFAIFLSAKLNATRGQIMHPFGWFDKLLRTVSSRLLEEISISVTYEFITTTLDISLHWHDVWNTLLSDQFQNLRRLSIVISAYAKPLMDEVVRLLNASDYVKKLRSCRTLIVDVKSNLTPYFCCPTVNNPVVKLCSVVDFSSPRDAPDIRWERWDRGD